MKLPENKSAGKNVKIHSKTTVKSATNSAIAKKTAEFDPAPKKTGGGNAAPPTNLEAATKNDTVNAGSKIVDNITKNIEKPVKKPVKKPVIDEKLDELARRIQRMSRVIDDNITHTKP